jgi:large subunit ribosomal protein L33
LAAGCWQIPVASRQPPIASGNTVMRDIIALACTECKRRNYSTTKNKKKTSERLELSKYCRFCRKHIAHRETK